LFICLTDAKVSTSETFLRLRSGNKRTKIQEQEKVQPSRSSIYRLVRGTGAQRLGSACLLGMWHAGFPAQKLLDECG